jgi:hypothetical protein
MSETAVINWPAGLPACPNGWTEKPLSVVLRSDVQVGVAKVRRRYTRLRITAQPRFVIARGARNTLASPAYNLFMQFFNVDCLGGARAFYFRHPYSKLLKTWRWLEEPTLTDFEGKFFQLTCSWEEL